MNDAIVAKVPQVGKDGLWRLRASTMSEDELGFITQKTGFFVFKTEEKANAALEKFNSNELAPVFGNKLPNGQYEVTYATVEAEVAA